MRNVQELLVGRNSGGIKGVWDCTPVVDFNLTIDDLHNIAYDDQTSTFTTDWTGLTGPGLGVGVALSNITMDDLTVGSAKRFGIQTVTQPEGAGQKGLLFGFAAPGRTAAQIAADITNLFSMQPFTMPMALLFTGMFGASTRLTQGMFFANTDGSPAQEFFSLDSNTGPYNVDVPSVDAVNGDKYVLTLSRHHVESPSAEDVVSAAVTYIRTLDNGYDTQSSGLIGGNPQIPAGCKIFFAFFSVDAGSGFETMAFKHDFDLTVPSYNVSGTSFEFNNGNTPKTQQDWNDEFPNAVVGMSTITQSVFPEDAKVGDNWKVYVDPLYVGPQAAPYGVPVTDTNIVIIDDVTETQETFRRMTDEEMVAAIVQDQTAIFSATVEASIAAASRRAGEMAFFVQNPNYTGIAPLSGPATYATFDEAYEAAILHPKHIPKYLVIDDRVGLTINEPNDGKVYLLGENNIWLATYIPWSMEPVQYEGYAINITLAIRVDALYIDQGFFNITTSSFTAGPLLTFSYSFTSPINGSAFNQNVVVGDNSALSNVTQYTINFDDVSGSGGVAVIKVGVASTINATFNSYVHPTAPLTLRFSVSEKSTIGVLVNDCTDFDVEVFRDRNTNSSYSGNGVINDYYSDSQGILELKNIDIPESFLGKSIRTIHLRTTTTGATADEIDTVVFTDLKDAIARAQQLVADVNGRVTISLLATVGTYGAPYDINGISGSLENIDFVGITSGSALFLYTSGAKVDASGANFINIVFHENNAGIPDNEDPIFTIGTNGKPKTIFRNFQISNTNINTFRFFEINGPGVVRFEGSYNNSGNYSSTISPFELSESANVEWDATLTTTAGATVQRLFQTDGTLQTITNYGPKTIPAQADVNLTITNAADNYLIDPDFVDLNDYALAQDLTDLETATEKIVDICRLTYTLSQVTNLPDGNKIYPISAQVGSGSGATFTLPSNTVSVDDETVFGLLIRQRSDESNTYPINHTNKITVVVNGTDTGTHTILYSGVHRHTGQPATEVIIDEVGLYLFTRRTTHWEVVKVASPRDDYVKVIVVSSGGNILLSHEHNGALVFVNNGAPQNVILPENATEALPAGYNAMIATADDLTVLTLVTEGTDVLISKDDLVLLDGKGSCAVVTKVINGSPAASTWLAVGDLS